MAILDRFRPQPRQKHPDPAVRLAYVQEIPLDDRDAISSMAREDEDPRVRKAAVEKLMDVTVLGELLRRDADEQVRSQAAAMLRGIALDTFEGVGESESLDAVDALDDGKMLALIAKTARREIVALRALSRLSDVHALGSIARHATLEAVRRAAFHQLRERGDRAELLGVAMNGEHKDTALAAVELFEDRPDLDQIAARSKNKAAAKRARTIVREAEERQAREATERQAREAAERYARELAERQAREAAQAREADSGTPDASEDDRKRLEAEAIRKKEQEIEASERARVEAEASAAREGARRQQEAEAREAAARTRREALARLQQLLGRVEPLAAKPEATLKALDRALQDLRTALADIPPLPSRGDFDEVSRRLKAAQSVLQPKAQELREADEWRRWANAGVQEQLCAKMEALGALDDPEAIHSEVRKLQEEWRQAADVPRARADALWHRFKTAHDAVWPRCEAHFAAQACERSDNLARKIALCEKAEALADSTRWIQTAEEIKRLQAEWKTVGAVPRGREKAVWDRFRVACDQFFTRRHDDLVQRKATWAENLAKKEGLCIRAEALATSTDWDAARQELKQLQAEWKTIGPVKQSRSEPIWQRFRTAGDAFFARYAQRHDTARAERIAAREAICAELEALAAAGGQDAVSPPEAPSADLLSGVRSLRARWQREIAERGVDPDRARTLDERFAAALASTLAAWPSAFAGSDLDSTANRKRMESLVQRVEELARSIAGAGSAVDQSLSPTTKLAAMLKEALAANTIGGKVEDDSRRRAAVEEVRLAQANWSRIGPLPDDVRRPLADRFQRACRRITEAGGTARTGGAGGTGRAGR
jgi:hypothetical protein